MDIVLRRLRGNNRVFGGVCIVSCGDHYQNEPIQDSLPLQSMLVRFNFSSLKLNALFRSRADENLQKIITVMRHPRLNEEEVKFVINTLQNHCDYKPEERVPLEATWLLATHEAVSEARERHFNRSERTKRIYVADDQV